MHFWFMSIKKRLVPSAAFTSQFSTSLCLNHLRNERNSNHPSNVAKDVNILAKVGDEHRVFHVRGVLTPKSTRSEQHLRRIALEFLFVKDATFQNGLSAITNVGDVTLQG